MSSLSASPDFIDRNSLTWSVNNPTNNAWIWTLRAGGTTLATRRAAGQTSETSTITTRHTGLTQNTTYSYSLTAVREDNGTVPSSSGYVPRSASATTWPFGGSFINATSPTSTSIRISGSVINNAGAATWRWRIRRLQSGGSTFTVVSSDTNLAAGGRANFDFINSGLASSTQYFYYLEAVNASTGATVQYFPSVGFVATGNTTLAPAPAPAFTNPPPASASLAVGTSYSFYIDATNTTSFSLTNVGTGVPLNGIPGLPPGMTLNSQTQFSTTSRYAFISGTPTTIGDYYWGIRADGPSGSTTITNRVWSVAVASPVFTDQSVTSNWVINKNFSTAPDRTVFAQNANSYSIIPPTSGTAANWILINNSGQLSGTPSTAGTYAFRVRATNTVGSSSAFTDSSNISVTVYNPVSWIDETLADGIVGVPYSDSVSAANATSYSLTPAFNLSTSGLSFNAVSATIAGTPKEIRSYTFTIVASNPGDSLSKEFTLNFRSGGKRFENGVAQIITNKKRYDVATDTWVDILNAKRWNAATNQWLDVSN